MMFISKLLALVPWSLRAKIKDIPLMGAVQRRIVAAFLDGREFVHVVDAGPAKGVAFLVHMPEDKGIWTGAYEFPFAKQLAEAVKPGSIAFDIGSWHGFFCGVMAAQGASKVHVFEPLPANADRIRKLISLNPTRAIELHQIAVGDSDSELDLVVMPDSSMAKLEGSSFQPNASSENRVRVKVRSVDSLIAEGLVEPPALMKIDVEGAELNVLRGARETLRAHRPEIFAEIHSGQLLEQCSALLEEAGYSVLSLDENHDVARAKDVFQIRASPVRG